MHRPLLAITLLLATVMLAVPSRAAEDPVYTAFLSDLAVGGYDPVAYFTEGRPIEGSSRHAVDYLGAEWRFASAANKAAFQADPHKFAPAYGGYCAWAVSQGYTAKGDPQIWKIVDGRLFLNYDDSVQARWERDIPGHVRSADANWPAVLK